MSPRAPAQKPQAPTEDPLAALRDNDDAGPPPPEAPEEEAFTAEAVTQDDWDQRRDLAILAMHEDLTVQGFVHGGGVCGCRYIAGVILQAVLPVQANRPELVGE